MHKHAIIVLLLIAAMACAATSNARADDSINPFGVATSAEASGQYPQYMEKLTALGVGSIRVFSEWAWVQPKPDQFNFGDEDKRVQSTGNAGLRINGMLMYGAPRWMTQDSKRDKAFPLDHLDDWKKYVETVVARYPSIKEWEVWNEPNSPGFNQGNNTPADYATLVRVASEAAKRVHPGVRIGIGCANLDVRYLRLVIESLEAQRAPRSYDFLAVHPYELLLRLRDDGGEKIFLSIVPNLRAMLRRVAAERAELPIKITEIGAQLEEPKKPGALDEREAAALLVKAYTLSLAQGIERIDWYEVKDAAGSRGFGLLDESGAERMSFKALGSLTDALGTVRPKFRGWMSLGASGRALGFLFTARGKQSLIAWAPKDAVEKVQFATKVFAVDITTRAAKPLPANTAFSLSDTPTIFTNVPSNLIRLSDANRAKALPWRGAPVAGHASIELGKPDASHGITLNDSKRSQAKTFEDGTTGVMFDKLSGNELRFSVDPEFANIETRDVYVRVTARTVSPTPSGRSTGMNLWYQPATGSAKIAPEYPYRSAGTWWTVPSDGQWHTYTWHLTDAMFAHTFGTSLYLRADDSHPFAVGRVEVAFKPLTDGAR